MGCGLSAIETIAVETCHCCAHYQTMSKPWIIALWVFTIALTAWLFWDDKTAAAFGVIRTASSLGSSSSTDRQQRHQLGWRAERPQCGGKQREAAVALRMRMVMRYRKQGLTAALGGSRSPG